MVASTPKAITAARKKYISLSPAVVAPNTRVLVRRR